MTDYLYSVSLSSQARLFLLSLGFGFFAGAVYDIFRAVRICLGNKKWAYRVTDVLYLVVLGFLNFLFFLSFNEGEFRLFMIFGEMLGLTVYLFTVGFTFSLCFEKLFSLIRRILTVFFKALISPFGKIRKKLCDFLKKYKKTKKKSENKSKYHLKVNNCLLYNLFNRKQNSEKCGKGAEISANKEKP